MTPETAEQIYYQTYEDLRQSLVDASKPLDQRDLRMKSWQAVIDALNEEFILSQALKYLKFSREG